MMPVTVEIRRASQGFVTREPGKYTRHAFSFGTHYDPQNVGFGPMVCHDDHLLGRGRGFEEHEHSDLEIVTWVVDGALVHSDADGNATTLTRGTVAVLAAGSGVRHAEIAAAAGPTRFVQVWLTPDRLGGAPSYATAVPELRDGELVEVVSGAGSSGALGLGTAGATLSVVRLGPGGSVTLPDHPRQHVYVGRGALVRSSLAQPLEEGDAFRIVDHPGLELTAAVPTELLVWTFDS